MESAIQYVLNNEHVPANFISLGVPFYSGHWWTDSTNNNSIRVIGGDVSFKSAFGNIKRYSGVTQFDQNDKINWAVVNNAGTYEYVFLEDKKSLQYKLELVLKYKFRGISAWVLGSEDPDIWSLL